MHRLLTLLMGATLAFGLAAAPTEAQQQRARAVGVAPGVLRPGPQNAITDVRGVRVGQSTVIAGDSIRTGVTAILPHPGNLFLREQSLMSVKTDSWSLKIGVGI